MQSMIFPTIAIKDPMKLKRAIIVRRVRLGLIAWAGSSVFFTAVLVVSELGHKSLVFAIYSNAVNFALWIALLPVLTWSAGSFPMAGPKRGWNGSALLSIVTVLAGLIAVSHLAIVYSTYFPFRSAYRSFRVLLQSELIRFMPVDVLIGIVLVVAFVGWQAFQAENTRANDLERQLAVARLEALRMQLHPHFLFNTLHTIAGLTVEDSPTARRMVIALGDLLRSTLRDTGDRMRTLAEELEYSDLYLGIEKFRLGDRLALSYAIEPSAARALVPQFLLQPLFENAIRHGASRMTAPCEIRFCAARSLDTLEIVIRNDGPKRDVSSGPLRFGVGLTNTMDRLRIHYGDRHTFQYSGRPEGGAQIKISIPCAIADDGIRASCSIQGPLSLQDRSDQDCSTAVPATGRN
jgi:two-component system, LytTR family, sensor kinase